MRRFLPALLILTVVPPHLLLAESSGNVTQLPIARVESMPRLPSPLAVRGWQRVAMAYYDRIFNPAAVGDSFPCVQVETGNNSFAMKSYLGADFANEAFTCLGGVLGARLAGLDPRSLHAIDWVERCKAWYDSGIGMYRHHAGDRSTEVHADIYGYWAAIQGTMLAALYPDDPDFPKQARTAATAFLRIAHGLGCPDHPDYDVLGWDFATNSKAGRNEPMNRLGHAPSVAWMLLVGAALTRDPEMLACAQATMRWYIEHSGRYEVSHLMGPLAAARINVAVGDQFDLGKVLAAWFGDGDVTRHPWRITAGTHSDHGITCDGLNGASWGDDGFYAFSMGSLQGPAWLIPVVRYDQRYARAIARYALHLANSARLLQGDGLDADHQDHAAWKEKWDKDHLFFYEGLKSCDPTPSHALKPYATGDVALLGWSRDHAKIDPKEYFAQRSVWFGNSAVNISLYMGNQVGFLGGIVATTDVPGILRWDCVTTDWFHAPAYPTHLYWNPYDQSKTIAVALGKSTDLYDLVSGVFLARRASNGYQLTLAADQAAVVVQVPPNSIIEVKDGRLVANGTTIDYRTQSLTRSAAGGR